MTGNIDPREHDAHELARMMIGRDMPPPFHADIRPVARNGWNWRSRPCRGRPLRRFAARGQLTVHAGEIVGIAGISGNGQAELARLISGEGRAWQTASATRCG